MNHPKNDYPRSFRRPAVSLMLALVLLVLTLPGRADRAPDVPDAIEVPEGNKVSFHVYANGVQIFKSNPDQTGWIFVAPEADLFADAGYHGKVGTHYAGPTWESNSGSKVVGMRLDGATVDTSAIPWLLLAAVSTTSPGVFEHTTYIQRVNTTGGLAPLTPPSSSDEIARVPYTAEYFFFTEENHKP